MTDDQPEFDPAVPRRLTEEAHKRCLAQALAAVEAAAGDESRLPPAPTSRQ